MSKNWTGTVKTPYVEYLVVGGGGGAGAGGASYGGSGGGAGGVLTGILPVTGGATNNVTIGGGGAGGQAVLNHPSKPGRVSRHVCAFLKQPTPFAGDHEKPAHSASAQQVARAS